MIQLGLLITNKHRLLSVAAILDVFESANMFYEQEHGAPFFNINLFSPDINPPQFYGAYEISSVTVAEQQNLILVPAFGAGDLKVSISKNQICIPWLRDQ